MKKAVLLVFCLFFFSCTHVNKSVDVTSIKGAQARFSKGVGLFQKGQLTSARNQLETLNYGDAYFVSGLLEIQKINYINNDWDRFFGLAVYYRNVLLSDDKRSSYHFRQEFLTLEALALLRHCRFQDSKKVMNFSLTLAKRIKKDSSKIKKVNYFLSLDKLLGIQNQDKNVNWQDQIYYWWPLDVSYLKQIDNPKNLRVKVNSQC